jgi:hypothetical protein
MIMKASQISTAVRLSLQTGHPAMIWGKPGVGKSNVVAQVAEAAGYELLDWRLCLMADVDLRGIPCVRDGLTYWNPPAELPRMNDKKRKPVLIFMDELPQAAISTTNAASQLILDRRLGDYRLRDDDRIVAAGNREEDRATAQRMPSHIANRFSHYTFDVDAAEWLTWATRTKIEATVRAFIKYRPAMLHTFNATSKEKAFASPRSWAFASDKLKALEALGVALNNEEMTETFSGTVGIEAATEFVGFLRIMHQLVSIEEILLTPDKAAVPSDPAVLYALVYALFDRADAKTFPAIVTYFDRVNQDFAYLFMKEIRQSKSTLMKSKCFIEWATRHQDFV